MARISKTARRDGAHPAAAGYSLLELLVALALAGAGLFGFAHVQYQGLVAEREQATRIHAALLFDEIARHLRAAPEVAAYAAGYRRSQGVSDCRASACTAREFAKFQVEQWKCRVAGGAGACAKPPGTAPAQLAITVSGASFTLRLRWKDAAGAYRIAERSGALY